MTDERNLGFNSMAVHTGYHAKKGPVNPPVERSSTYAFDTVARKGPNASAAQEKRASIRGFTMPIAMRLREGLRRWKVDMAV